MNRFRVNESEVKLKEREREREREDVGVNRLIELQNSDEDSKPKN